MAPAPIIDVTNTYQDVSLTKFDETTSLVKTVSATTVEATEVIPVPHGRQAVHVRKDGLIAQAMKKRIGSIDSDTCDVGDEDAFFVADLGEVYRQHMRWKNNLGRVKPHYGTFSLQYH